MRRGAIPALALALLLPVLSLAAPSSQDRGVHPRELSGLPSYVKRVEPSIVGLRVRAPENAPSSARLGSRRFGSAVIFDARGYAVTVSYLLLDAASLEARSRDGLSDLRPSREWSRRARRASRGGTSSSRTLAPTRPRP